MAAFTSVRHLRWLSTYFCLKKSFLRTGTLIINIKFQCSILCSVSESFPCKQECHNWNRTSFALEQLWNFCKYLPQWLLWRWPKSNLFPLCRKCRLTGFVVLLSPRISCMFYSIVHSPRFMVRWMRTPESHQLLVHCRLPLSADSPLYSSFHFKISHTVRT